MIDKMVIECYSKCVTDNVCRYYGIDPNDKKAKAILAWNITHPENKIKMN